MNWFIELGRRLLILLRRRQLEADLEEEMRLHLELREQEQMERGLAPDEARYAARRQFGNPTLLKEVSREMWGWNWLEDALQDVRYGLRQLRHNPGFMAASVPTLAFGICASVAIFAFVDAALLRPLPYRDPSRLVGVTESIALFPRANLSYPDYLDWKRLNTVFSSLDVWTGDGYLLRTPEGTRPIMGARVSDGFFHTLGITPVLGRDFYAGEDLPSAPHSVMLSFTAWQKWFGGKKDVIGQPVTLSGTPYTIVGVLPREFQFAPTGRAEFWTTLHPNGSCDLRRSCHSLDGIARLKGGVSVRAALANMTSIAAQLEKQYPDSNRGQGATVVPLSDWIVGDIRPILLVLLGAAGLLLLIACVNVTSLLVAHSESRRREIAVRGALGASARRLVRQFAAEGLVLVAAGGVLGLVSAEWSMRLLVRLIPTDMMGYMPYLDGLGLNLHGVLFAGAVWLLAAVLFALTPTFRLSLSDLGSGLAEGGRGAAGTMWRRFGSNLVVVELAIAVVLLVGSGLLAKSLYRLLHVELGFEPDHLAMMEVAAPPTTYGKDAQLVAVGRQIISRIAGLPGVKAVAITTRQLPVSFNGNTDWIRFVGRPYNGQHNEVNERDVSAAYFTTLQAKLVRGRYFIDAEDASKPGVVIINQALTRKYFPGEDPIGKQIGDTELSPKSLKQIIGVVDDIREGSLDSDNLPTEYLPFNQSPGSYIGIVARTSQAPESLLLTLETAIHQIDPGIGTASETTMTQRIHDSGTAYLHRSAAWLVGGFAALALLLGVVGLYGVIAYSVSQRTREIGVRMALGAERSSVYKLILKEAAWLTGIGIAVGLVCSVAAATLMRNLLFGTQAWDVTTLAVVSCVLAPSAMLASFMPARRAAKLDPMVALRHE